MYVWMYVCTYVCMYVCMYVCISNLSSWLMPLVCWPGGAVQVLEQSFLSPEQCTVPASNSWAVRLEAGDIGTPFLPTVCSLFLNISWADNVILSFTYLAQLHVHGASQWWLSKQGEAWLATVGLVKKDKTSEDHTNICVAKKSWLHRKIQYEKSSCAYNMWKYRSGVIYGYSSYSESGYTNGYGLPKFCLLGKYLY